MFRPDLDGAGEGPAREGAFVVDRVLLDQRLERALPVTVGVRGTGRVEADRALALMTGCPSDAARLDLELPRVAVDRRKGSNKGSRRGPEETMKLDPSMERADGGRVWYRIPMRGKSASILLP